MRKRIFIEKVSSYFSTKILDFNGLQRFKV